MDDQRPEDSAEEEFPTIARSDFFEIWEDKEDGSLVISFDLNGVTVDVERELFSDFARVVAEAAERLRAMGQ